MLAAMNLQPIPARVTDKDGQLGASPPAAEKTKKLFSRGQTALSKGLNPQQEGWLLDYAVSRWQSLHGALGGWRQKLARFEKMADDDYSDRKSAPDARSTDAKESIFSRQNHTLGIASGFADFAYSQARDDIFGTRPWLAATPEGPASIGLADRVTKNSQWKINQSNLEGTLLDSLRIACDLGTAFVGERWVKEVEITETAQHVAVSLASGQPILDAAGDYISDAAGLPPDMDPADLEWKEMLVENSDEVANNVEASIIDYKNIAFDNTKSELKLHKTDVFHRFSMGLHDLVAAYNLTDEQREQLLGLCNTEGNEEPREHRDESDTSAGDAYQADSESNPTVWMVEGFMRCDPFKTNRVIRIHIVFSPMLNALFTCDYLSNVTPKGILPIFPVRCFKIANRITGKGYFERVEDANTAVDGQYNAVTLRNRSSAEVVKCVHPSALMDESEGKDLVLDPDKVWLLKEDKSGADFITFIPIPDSNNRADALMQEMAQMAQIRFGISSSARGEMKGLPQNNTATGVNQMISRGAVLLKWPIDQMTDDLTPIVELAVHLHYANHDHDETFVWGEGKDAELIEIKGGDVKGLRMKVTLTLTQAQNQQKLQNAQVGISIVSGYTMLPEAEKAAPRRVFVQALASLGFDDADQLIRAAAVDPQGILALLPPDLQPVFAAFLQSQGMLPPADPNAAPQDAAAAAPLAPVTDGAPL